jgi:hypothetical protein
MHGQKNIKLAITDPEVYKFSRNFQKYISYLKIQSVREAKWSKFHTEEPQISEAIVQNFVAAAIWRPEVVHPCIIQISAKDCLNSSEIFFCTVK